MNEQTLLNLARLHNGHPPYYLVVGTINNKFNFQGSVSGGGEWTDSSSATQGLTRGGEVSSGFSLGDDGALGLVSRTIKSTVGSTLGAVSAAASKGTVGGSLAASNSPDFQFIPLNNNEVSKQFLDSIPVTAFYALFEQGYPLDMLMRVLVERVEFSIDGRTMVMVNSPLSGKRMTNEGGEWASSYARFLRATDMARELQLNGHLELAKTQTPPQAISYTSEAPKAKDLLAASEKGMSYRKTGGNWELMGSAGSGTRFQIRTGSKDEAIKALRNAPGDFDDEAIKQLVGLLYAPPSSSIKAAAADSAPAEIAIVPPATLTLDQKKIRDLEKLLEEEKARNTDSNLSSPLSGMVAFSRSQVSGEESTSEKKAQSNYKVRLVMRSYARALEAVATEQDDFDKLLQTGGLAIVRPQQLQPIIRTVWNDRQKTHSSLLTLRYDGETHRITDPVQPLEDANPRWNRDVFKLLVALASQVSVDLSKYQRSVIELR
ncbi:MAG: hypothetical protein ACAH88_21065 [Roseimicrobium sp.]